MVYSKDSTSSDLKPVLLAVSAVTALVFGGMYAFYANSSQHTAANAATSEAVGQPVGQQQLQPSTVQPVTTAAKPKTRSRV